MKNILPYKLFESGENYKLLQYIRNFYDAYQVNGGDVKINEKIKNDIGEVMYDVDCLTRNNMKDKFISIKYNNHEHHIGGMSVWFREELIKIINRKYPEFKEGCDMGFFELKNESVEEDISKIKNVILLFTSKEERKKINTILEKNGYYYGGGDKKSKPLDWDNKIDEFLDIESGIIYFNDGNSGKRLGFDNEDFYKSNNERLEKDYKMVKVENIDSLDDIEAYIEGEGMGFFELKTNENNTNPKRNININDIDAVNNNDIETLKRNLKGNVDINSFFSGYSLLLRACYLLNVEIVKFLLENGANPNIQNNKGHFPLLYTIASIKNVDKEKVLETIKMLIEYGANVNLKNEHGLTALQVATNHEQYDVLKLLIDNDAHPQKDNEGNYFYDYDNDVFNWVKKNYPHIIESSNMGFFD